MDKKATQFIEAGFLAAWVAAFLAINFSNILGLIYLGFIVVFTLRAIFDDKINIPISKGGSWLSAILLGIGTYVGFTLLSTLVISKLMGQAMNFTMMLKVYGATLPALAQSQLIALIAYGLFIPFVETVAFLSAYEYGTDKLGYDKLSLLNIRTWFIALLVSGLFVLFHLTAKGTTNTIALTLVFAMMLISIIITAIFKDMRPAIIFHILANLIAMSLKLGLVSAV